jgi:hypothetical protein
MFDRRMRDEVAPAIQSVAATAMEWRLVEDDDLTENIALQKVAGRLREQCGDEFSLLGERVALLLGKGELNDQENPVGPDAICAALKTACDEMEGSVKTKLVLFTQIEQHLSKALQALYVDLNSTMVRWNVLPDLRPGYRRPLKQQSAPTPGRNAAESPFAAGQASGGGQSALDVFAALQSLIQGRQSGAPHSGPGASPAPSLVPGGARTEDFSAGLLESLTRMQRGESSTIGHAASDGLPDIGEAVATMNVLRQIQASAAAEGVGQLDAITIDIVAMLFDFIFDDAKIPDAIKALVGRLQIPLLKVAMLDKSFFSSKAHPARRLLDGISRASMGWGREVDPEDTLYKEISRIVERVQTDFERDVQIFVELLSDLDAVQAARETESERMAEQSAELMQKRESQEIAWIIAGEAISRKDSSSVPPVLRQFLLQHWQQVLMELCLRYGEDHHNFLSAVATMDDLIWSVAAKENGEQRKQLVGTLPGLLRALHVGLDLIGLQEDARDAFFDDLVTLHSAAVKAGLNLVREATPDEGSLSDAGGVAAAQPFADSTTGASREPEASGERESPHAASPADQYLIHPEGELLVTRISQDDVQIEEVALVGATESAPDADIYRGWVSQLKRGDWVEFTQNDGTAARGRLSWISPQRGVYLFTNPQSARATSVSPEALAHQFRIGLAEMILDEPLFDRAVNGVLGSLQAA